MIHLSPSSAYLIHHLEEKENVIKNTLLQRLKHNQICIKSFSTKKNDHQIGLELDMEVERYLISSALTGIISQKLARRLCPKCKKLRPTNEYEKTLA